VNIKLSNRTKLITIITLTFTISLMFFVGKDKQVVEISNDNESMVSEINEVDTVSQQETLEITTLESTTEDALSQKQALDNTGDQINENIQLQSERDLIYDEVHGIGQQRAIDNTVTNPSAENNGEATTDIYSDQIEMKAIIKQALADNYEVEDSSQLQDFPTGKNVMSAALGENAAEIDQKRIFEKAKYDGYAVSPAEVAPDSHPPTTLNDSSQPKGEYAEEINL